MAKGKHAAALFEVINKGKKQETSRGSILRTPSWWFKNRAPADSQQTPSQPVQPAQPVPPSPPDSAPSAQPALPPKAAAPATAPSEDQVVTEEPCSQLTAHNSQLSEASEPALAVDPDRKLIALRLSYTTAGIGAFILLLIVSVAYLIGRQVNTGPAPAIAARSTEQIRQDDPQPQVLDITRGAPVSSIPPAQQTQPRPQPAPAQQTQTVQAPPNAQAPTAYVEDDGTRTIGLNYVIIQSYRDEQMAHRYAQLLIQDGIRCTVEKDLPNWSESGWYSIVGTRGFARIRNSEFEDYIESIRRVNNRHGLTGFRRFDPQPYHWKGTR